MITTIGLAIHRILVDFTVNVLGNNLQSDLLQSEDVHELCHMMSKQPPYKLLDCGHYETNYHDVIWYHLKSV